MNIFTALRGNVLATVARWALSWQGKAIAAAALSIAVSYSTWYITSDHYQKRIAEMSLDMAEAVQKQLLEEARKASIAVAKRKSAEETHAKDQLTINNLRDHNQRLRLDQICSSTVQQSGATGEDPDRRTGVLSEAAEAAFAELQRGIDEDFARCDQLNIDARQVNASQ